jgi:hypothetical protein
MNYQYIPDNIFDIIKQLIILIIYILVIIINISKIAFTKSDIYFIPIVILLGYFAGDFFSGIYHYFMDTYDIPFLSEFHKNFRIHHDNPLSLERFPFSSHIVEIMPVGIIKGLITQHVFENYSLFLLASIISNIVMCSAQVAHRFSHRRTHEYDKNGEKQFYIPDFVKFLQDKKIILNNKEHRKHHLTEVMNYSISNGSSSSTLDKVIDIFNLPVSTYKNSDNMHKMYNSEEKYDIIYKYLK